MVPLPAQGCRGRAWCMLPARRQLSALGTSRFPASAAKEPSLPKLLRAAETVPGKASTGAAPPPPPALSPSRTVNPHRPHPRGWARPIIPSPSIPRSPGVPGTWCQSSRSSIPAAGPSAQVWDEGDARGAALGRDDGDRPLGVAQPGSARGCEDTAPEPGSGLVPGDAALSPGRDPSV